MTTRYATSAESRARSRRWSIAWLIDYTLPASIRSEPIDRAYRARVLVSACFVALLFMIPFAVARGFWNGFTSPVCLTLAACCVFLATTPVLFRLFNSVSLPGLFLTFSTTCVLIAYAYFDGGYYSTALAWFPIIPLFSVFFAGFRWGLFIGVLLMLDLAALWFLHEWGMVPANSLSESQTNLLYYGSTTAVMLLLLLLSNLYVTWQEQIQNELLRANQSKDEFLSGVSHNLRTPLNSILGFSEVLEKGYSGKLNPEQREYVELIHGSGNQLLAFVDDLLDISAIDTGSVDFNPVESSAAPLIEGAVAELCEAAEDKQVEVIVDIEPAVREQKMLLDKVRFQQMVENLLSNAIKFSPQAGLVNVHAGMIKDRLRLVFEDQGPGVKQEDRERIFDRFPNKGLEIDGSEGTGLGLALTRHYANLHGGEVFVTERTGRAGSAFVVTLPISREEGSTWVI